MNFTHAIADKLEAALPVRVIQWGLHDAPAVVTSEKVSEEEESNVIHKAASWLREHGFVDIRFETGHDEYEDQPVVILRHPWNEEVEYSPEDVEIETQAIIAKVENGDVDGVIDLLENKILVMVMKRIFSFFLFQLKEHR